LTYPIEIQSDVNPGETITVTMSYANAWPEWTNFYSTDQLVIAYRSSQCTSFHSLEGIVDTDAKTVTSVLQPEDVSSGSQSGQYAIAVDCNCAPGEGGG